MAIKRTLHAFYVQLITLLRNPTLYVCVGLLFVFFYQMNEGARKLLAVSGLRLNALGYAAGAFSGRGMALVLGLGAAALFADMPMIRENVLYETVRCSRNVWIAGRMVYVVFLSLAYVLVMLLLCVATCRGELTFADQWGKLLNTLANGYVFEEIHVPVELSLQYMARFTPPAAVAVSLLFAWGAAALIGLVMLGISLLLGRLPALLCGSLIALFDFAIEDNLPLWCYRFSPASFMRLSIVANNGSGYTPGIGQAALTLGAMLAAACLLCVLAARRNRAFARQISREQY